MPSEELSEELVNEVDNSGAMTPGDRAKKVWIELKKTELSNWDVTCFVIEFIGSTALAYPILMAAAKVCSKWLYQMHYVHKGFKET